MVREEEYVIAATGEIVETRLANGSSLVIIWNFSGVSGSCLGSFWISRANFDDQVSKGELFKLKRRKKCKVK